MLNTTLLTMDGGLYPSQCETYTSKQKRHILERINMLTSTEHEEILRIVKKHMVSFSQNKNGVFFNLSILPTHIIQEIDNFVTYCIANKKELDEYDKIINECKMNNKLDGMIPVISTSLSNMAKNSDEANAIIDKRKGWSRVKVDNIVMDKFVRFADRVISEREKLCKKKMNVKFNNAKKKYAKKVEKKMDELHDELVEEAYIIHRSS
jgi:hypothetical protein